MQLETLADVFRSDQLAWRVILEKKLYEGPDFKREFQAKFPAFHPDAPSSAAEAYLLEEFRDRLHVGTLPRTLLFEIRYRSRDAAVSADVVNALIRAYGEQDADMRFKATSQAAGWLGGQLKELRARVASDDRRLAEFQKRHKLLISAQTMSNGQPGQTPHLPELQAVDELGRELVSASAERILREAQYRAASQGDPELVLASDPRMLGESGGLSMAAFRQIQARRSELEQERTQLSLEHGPNFPRVLEIQQQLQDLDRQVRVENTKLKDRFRSAWQTAVDHEQLLRKSLNERTTEGLLVNEAATQYAAMREEADASHALYMRIQEKMEEAGLAAGVHSPDLWVVDEAHPPAKPVTPNLPLFMAITLFASLWLAAGAALLVESFRRSTRGVIAGLLATLVWAGGVQAQAPTPSTSGLPTGVARIPGSTETRSSPNERNAPTVWTGNAVASQAGLPAGSGSSSSTPMAAPIAPGDLLDITEFHLPEFHSSVRVSPAGTVTLPLVNEVKVEGMSESEAAKAIAAELVIRGMLLHPQVFVLVTAYVGQDVSVLGEVTRPGIYAYAQHHRLLDLISAASGLSAGAGSLVNIYHRDVPNTPQRVVLDGSGDSDHNPELAPGDTVEVSRGGLIYVVGDVIRPGGFAVDGTQATTVLQALSLAWGPSQNAALKKAVLIREQKDGRTVTSLNLARMLRGQDPDVQVRERDILFVPDSTAKNLWNRTIESAIQSAAGVSIYSGLVYSQRF
jgi:polysaccharide export outer membrane protein